MRPAGVAGLAVLSLTLAAAGVPACGGDDREITVLAASSLTDAFGELADLYEQESGTRVRLVFAGSSQLATQIEEGAAADVFASASPEQMSRLELPAGAEPEIFARNTITLALAPGNPGQVTTLDSLTDPSLRVAACVVDVPCGDLASDVMASSGLEIEVDSFEPNVRAVLTKLGLGEIDAGFVYRSDAAAAALETRELPAAASTSYPIVALDDGGAGFVDLVTGEKGRAVMAAHGFEAP